MTTQRTRLHIDRLQLDLRGISPATARAAAHMLGPALRVCAGHMIFNGR